MKWITVLFCMLAILPGTGALAQEPIQAPPEQSETFPLYRYTLPNGLRVWCQPRPDSQSVATLLVVDAGARDETPSNNGISHFVEHMLFTGTERWSEEEIKQIIDRQGGEWNGWTGIERATYFAHVAAQDLDLALDWLAELVFRATFPEDKVDKEREVIFQERSGRYGWLINALDALGFGYELERDVRRALFPGSTLGLRVAGEDASLESLDRPALLDYYQQHYRPDNAVLIVVGKAAPEQVLARAEAYFGGLEQVAGPSRPAPQEAPLPLPVEGPHRVLVRGPDLTDQVSLMTGARTVGRAHPDQWALRVLAEVLDEDLMEEIRYQRGLVYSLAAFNVWFDDAGYFAVGTTSHGDDTEAIQQTVAEHLEAVRRGEVSPQAVERAKAALQGRWALSMEDNVERAIWQAQWTSVLSEGDPVPDYLVGIDAVTPEDLSRVVQTYFAPERSFTGLHQPVVTVASSARIAGAVVLLGVGAWGLRRLRRRARARDAS
jgi:predicted Zn-dependent peptidase